MNFVEGTVTDVDEGGIAFQGADLAPIRLPARGLDLARGQKATLGVRPADLEASAEGRGWDIVVSVSEQHGADSYLHCDFTTGAPLLIHQPGQAQVRRGDRLRVHPHAERWHLFDEAGQRIGPNH
jgi:multiple sugar transport system ATP-binding protein